MYNLSKISRRSFGLIKNNISTLSVIKNKPKKNEVYFRKYSETAQTRTFIDTRYCHSKTGAPLEIDSLTFEKVSEETLQSLTDFFEELVDANDKLESADIAYSSGVLTANLGKYGIYVINRQSPNKQIWLSSPISGPKRYDYDQSGDSWIYRHDMKSLHALLQKELSSLLKESLDLSNCSHS